MHQLNAKCNEDEAVAAVRHVAHYDLGSVLHRAAYLNHLVKHYNHAAAAVNAGLLLGGGALTPAGRGPCVNTAAAGGAAAAAAVALAQQSQGTPGTPGSLGAFGGQIRLASVPVSTKAMLQKLPLKVFRQLEALVAGSPYLEWRHFDAGVVKVRSTAW